MCIAGYHPNILYQVVFQPWIPLIFCKTKLTWLNLFEPTLLDSFAQLDELKQPLKKQKTEIKLQF